MRRVPLFTKVKIQFLYNFSQFDGLLIAFTEFIECNLLSRYHALQNNEKKIPTFTEGN